MKIDAKVVRLTPEQKEQRQLELQALACEREDRLKARRYQQFLVLKSEFSDMSEDEANHLITRAQLEEDTARAGVTLGVGKKIAHAAFQLIAALKKLLPWNWVKGYAIRQGFAAALILGGTMSATCVMANGATRWVDTLNPNGITTVGLNHALDVVFHAGTQVTTWYMGLIQGSSPPTLAAGDSMGSHGGWSEYTAYDETNRVAWDEGAASSGVTTNSVTMDFSMNATGTVAGGFLTSASDKTGTTGTLWMTATFSGGNQAVGSGDTLKLTYTLSTSSS